MRTRTVFIVVLCVCAGLVVAAAVSAPALAQAKPKIVTTPVTPTSPASGAEMFKQYCASCHGVDGKGHGPAAAALKAPVPDLTTMAARNGGKFPEPKVYAIITGDTAMPAHGTADMPVWGTVLRSVSKGESELHQRIGNLTKHIDKLGKK